MLFLANSNVFPLVKLNKWQFRLKKHFFLYYNDILNAICLFGQNILDRWKSCCYEPKTTFSVHELYKTKTNCPKCKFVFLYCLCFYWVLFALMPFHFKYRQCDRVLFENFSVFPIYSNVTSIYRDISSAPVHTPLHVNVEYFLRVVYTAVHKTQTTETYIKSECGKSIQNM